MSNRIASFKRGCFKDGAQERECHYCGKMVAREKITADHKVPKALGGSDKRGNLVLSCADCNSRKGKQSYEAFQLSMMNERIANLKQRRKYEPKWSAPRSWQNITAHRARKD